MAEEWVHWFINGEARSFPADSVTGRDIIARLDELEPSVDHTPRRAQQVRQTRRAMVSPAVARGAAPETAIAKVAETYSSLGKWKGVCSAPKALFPNQVCGKTFWSRKNQRFCSDSCRKRAARAAAEMPDAA